MYTNSNTYSVEQHTPRAMIRMCFIDTPAWERKSHRSHFRIVGGINISECGSLPAMIDGGEMKDDDVDFDLATCDVFFIYFIFIFIS